DVAPPVARVAGSAAPGPALPGGAGGAAADGPRQAERDGTGRAARWRARPREAARAAGGPWLEIVDAIAEALPRDAIVAGDSAMAGYYRAPSDPPPPPPRAVPLPPRAGPPRLRPPPGRRAQTAHPATPATVLHGGGTPQC